MPVSRPVIRALALLILFVAIVLIGDAFTTRQLLRGDTSNAGRIGQVIDGNQADVIPIFGASQATCNFLPAVLGPQYRNYGLSGTSLEVTNLLLSFEERKVSAQPIVIDLHEGPYKEIGDVRDYIPFANKPQVEGFLRKQSLWQWRYRVPGIRYYGSFDLLAKSILRNTAEGGCQAFGEDEWSRDNFDAIIHRQMNSPRFVFGIDDGDLLAFRQHIRTMHDRFFFIVLSPFHESYLVGAKNEKKFRAQLALLQREPNVRIVDWMRAKMPDRYFRDPVHLDLEGAKVFSAALAARINAEMPQRTQ